MTADGFRFRAATAADMPQLMQMWRACFDDTAEGTSHIFTHLQKPEHMLVLADGAGPAAMLSMLDFALETPMGAHKAAYLYGVATSPQKQGKGLGSALLDETVVFLRDNGYACAVLVPASESLFGYYGKRGYTTAFYIKKAEVAAAEIGAGDIFSLEPLDAAGLASLRDAAHRDSMMFARWDEKYLDYVVRESIFYGGGAFAFTVDGAKICAVCHKSGGTVYVKELTATPQTLAAALRSIHAHFGAEKYQLYLRADFKTDLANRMLPFAMLQWYDNKAETAADGGDRTAYIAHVLD